MALFGKGNVWWLVVAKNGNCQKGEGKAPPDKRKGGEKVLQSLQQSTKKLDIGDIQLLNGVTFASEASRDEAYEFVTAWAAENAIGNIKPSPAAPGAEVLDDGLSDDEVSVVEDTATDFDFTGIESEFGDVDSNAFLDTFEEEAPPDPAPEAAKKAKPKIELTTPIQGPKSGLWELQVKEGRLYRVEVELEAGEEAQQSGKHLLDAISAGKVELAFREGHVKITAGDKNYRVRLLFASKDEATAIRDASLKA